MLTEGLTHTSEMRVEERHTARAIGSGDLEICATPAMIALMENAAMLAVADQLTDEETTVGGFIEVSHLKPTAKGNVIRATALLTKIDGRKLHFAIEAFEGEKAIGRGTHIRVIVNREKFNLRIREN